MARLVDLADNLFDYFHEGVEASASDAGTVLSVDTRLYLSNLLTERARTDREAPHATTLVELHAAASAAAPGEQARTYRELGDRALYDLGYFREHVDRGIVSPSYVESMGAAAYARVDSVLRTWFSDAFGPVFREMSARFHDCVGVIGGVRALHDASDDLQALYQTWLDTGDEDAARKLRRRGLVIPRSRPCA